LKVKEERACRGCLGGRWRRRAWQAAKSPEELHASVDTGSTRMGQPAWE